MSVVTQSPNLQYFFIVDPTDPQGEAVVENKTVPPPKIIC